MKTLSTLAVAAAGFLALQAWAQPAQAQDASVQVIHGINGSDLGLDEALTVDISVNGGCALPGVSFRDIARNVPLPAGSYEIAVSLADEGNPCGGLLAVSGRVELAVFENASIIAHLNQGGSPTLTKVTNNVSTLGAHETRLAVVHAAVAPPVDVQARPKRGSFRNSIRIDGLANGEQSFPGDAAAGDYQVRISPDTSFRSLAKVDLRLDEQVAYTAFAVGSLANGTFDLILLDQSTAGGS